MDVSELRSQAAKVMRRTPEDYLPYLTTSEGDLLDEEGFNQYLHKIESTHEWGGQVEVNYLNIYS